MTKPMKVSKSLSLYQSTQKNEYKVVETNIPDLSLPATSAFTGAQLLNGIVQGPGNQQRVGRRLVLKSLVYRMYASTASEASPTNGPVRVLVVYDRQANGAVPLNTDVLAQADFAGLMNLGYTDRFLIISDQIHQSENGPITVGECYKKMSLEQVFIGTGGTITDISTGSILVFLAHVGASAAVVNFNFRIRYVDA